MDFTTFKSEQKEKETNELVAKDLYVLSDDFVEGANAGDKYSKARVEKTIPQHSRDAHNVDADRSLQAKKVQILDREFIVWSRKGEVYSLHPRNWNTWNNSHGDHNSRATPSFRPFNIRGEGLESKMCSGSHVDEWIGKTAATKREYREGVNVNRDYRRDHSTGGTSRSGEGGIPGMYFVGSFLESEKYAKPEVSRIRKESSCGQEGSRNYKEKMGEMNCPHCNGGIQIWAIRKEKGADDERSRSFEF